MTAHRNTKTPSAHAIADYFLLKVDVSAGDTLSNLKLQKLCYFAQIAAIIKMGRPMFDDEIQAWAHGPVVVKLYRRFRKYGWQAIDPTNLKTAPHKVLGDEEQKILDTVWDSLSGFSAKHLEDLSHQTQPWKDAYTPEKLGLRCTNPISVESIEAFCRSGTMPDGLKCLA